MNFINNRRRAPSLQTDKRTRNAERAKNATHDNAAWKWVKFWTMSLFHISPHTQLVLPTITNIRSYWMRTHRHGYHIQLNTTSTRSILVPWNLFNFSLFLLQFSKSFQYFTQCRLCHLSVELCRVFSALLLLFSLLPLLYIFFSHFLMSSLSLFSLVALDDLENTGVCVFVRVFAHHDECRWQKLCRIGCWK